MQRPHPPLYVGGGGRHVLALAAAEADVVGVNSKATADGAVDLGDRSGRAFDEKVRWIREAAGERWGELELNTLIQQVKVTDNREQGAQEVLGAYASWPPDMIVNIPGHGEEILDAPRTASSGRLITSSNSCRSGASGGASPTSPSTADTSTPSPR